MIPKSPVAPDISVIITAHSEGRFTHRSAKSAQRAACYARAAGITVELVAVMDCPSQETLSYFEEGEKIFEKVTTIEVRDFGLARNHGVEITSGKCIAFLNAGDLFSENWLAAAFRLASENQKNPLVLHPELNVFFSGKEVHVDASIDSDNPGYSPLELIQFNPWASSSFVSRAFFLDGNLFAAVRGSGFGRQDWHWNCEVIANGAAHRIVPGTAHFFRGWPDLAKQREQTFRPSKLFNQPLLRNFTSDSPALTLNAEGNQQEVFALNSNALEGRNRNSSKQPSFIRHRVKKSAPGLVRAWPDLLRLGGDIKGALKKFRASVVKSRPLSHLDYDWLLQEWAHIHEIDTELFPTKEILKQLDHHAVPRSAIASYYSQLDELTGNSPTHLFLLPWLIRGGADVVAIEFMTAVVKANNGSRITCILTEDRDSPWITKLPEEVGVVEFGKLLRGFSENDKASLLLRLLIQKRPHVIHNINSRLGYKLFTESGPSLAAESNLFASLFGFEFLPEGELGGYAVWDLPNCIDYLSRVLTDSRWFIDRLCDLYGFQRSKFSVLHVPAPSVLKKQSMYDGKGVINILWASRFWQEKRPDVLLEIVSRLVGLPFHFHVYGADMNDSLMHSIFEKLSRFPNVTTYGYYDGFGSLPAEKFDVFLYTSERDGMPNVLLEATSAGLPVIAPDVGGIKELINDTTGFLVSGPDVVDDYVRYLKNIQNDYQIAAPRIRSAQGLIESRNSWSSFISALEQLPGYLDR